MHSNSLLTETVSSSPQTVTENNLKVQFRTANLKGTKSMPNLWSSKSRKEISESGSKRTGRSTSHFGNQKLRLVPGYHLELILRGYRHLT